MEKAIKIKVPKGYEIDEEHSTFECIKFKKKEFPKTWEEFCEDNPIKCGEAYFSSNSHRIWIVDSPTTRRPSCSYMLPNLETADAIQVLCKLIQLRDCYNQGWQPDWNSIQIDKYTIDLFCDKMKSDETIHCGSILYFKTPELRDLFLENFRDLIEKLKPLYGIKEGGKQ